MTYNDVSQIKNYMAEPRGVLMKKHCQPSIVHQISLMQLNQRFYCKEGDEKSKAVIFSAVPYYLLSSPLLFWFVMPLRKSQNILVNSNH